MEQMSIFPETRAPLTVTELSRALRLVLESDQLFQNVWVRGEISNFSRPKSGHWYFTLKDRNAQLPCVMWRSTAELQAHVPQDGEELEVHGGLSVYEAGGRYQLYVDQIRVGGGDGALYQQFMELKSRLEAEGLFAPSRKRPIPAWPARIGIVTSPSGAALHDILHTLSRRFPFAEVTLAPAVVQGDGAAIQIEAALKRLNHYVKPHVIILARGGGSLEDLAPFNSERLARTIVASQAPVICGVGHETDFSIADFAADLRAPTPTAAAELASPNLADLKATLQSVANQLARYSPVAMVRRERQRVDELAARSARAARQAVLLQRSGLAGVSARLEALNPAAVLDRGYAIVSKADGATVRNAASVAPAEELNVRVSEGQFKVTVKGK
jgi:exodeoxyribonuclease VII large subunit